MKHPENVKIIAFVGLAGSGKSTAVDYMTQKGYPKVYFGGVMLNEVKKRGLELTLDNEKKVREEVRRNEGKDFVAKEIIAQLHNLISSGQHYIIADGLYSWTEYKALKHEFPGELIIIAIVAPSHLRKTRMATRPIRPLTPAELDQRDWAEIEGIEKGGPIAVADYYIINNKSLDYLHGQLDEICEHINFAK